VPVDKHDYPPSPKTIARKKALYALRHAHGSNNAVASAPQDATGSSAMTN
jgi:hypothetical protein